MRSLSFIRVWSLYVVTFSLYIRLCSVTNVSLFVPDIHSYKSNNQKKKTKQFLYEFTMLKHVCEFLYRWIKEKDLVTWSALASRVSALFTINAHPPEKNLPRAFPKTPVAKKLQTRQDILDGDPYKHTPHTSLLPKTWFLSRDQRLWVSFCLIDQIRSDATVCYSRTCCSDVVSSILATLHAVFLYRRHLFIFRPSFLVVVM